MFNLAGLFRQNRAILLRILVRKQGLDIPIAAHQGAATREEQTWALQLDPPREIPSTQVQQNMKAERGPGSGRYLDSSLLQHLQGVHNY